MKRFHLALTTRDLPASITDYTSRFGVKPELVVKNEYALWRTDSLNISVRMDLKSEPGLLRHLGWEDPSVSSFSEEADVNGILWERFSAELQKDETIALWPSLIGKYS
ncbi:MAG: hypothetical protein ACRBCI_07690 [Cellvibrionaceae bacterium]